MQFPNAKLFQFITFLSFGEMLNLLCVQACRTVGIHTYIHGAHFIGNSCEDSKSECMHTYLPSTDHGLVGCLVKVILMSQVCMGGKIGIL